MPSVRQRLHSPASQPQSIFPMDHGSVLTLVEYALILGLVVVLVIITLIVLGPTPSAITNVGSSHV